MKLLKKEFLELLQPSSAAPQPKHGVVHHILTDGRPVFAKARRLEPAKCRITKEEFATLEKAVSRSTSPWASPLHMVAEKDRTWRLCGDYRRFNTITVPERYPLPNMMDLSTNMEGCTIFNQIDLVKAFHQVPIALRTTRKQLSSHPLDCLRIITCHLASVMLPKYSKGCKIQFSEICLVRLFI
jgi:hypothetical protein